MYTHIYTPKRKMESVSALVGENHNKSTIVDIIKKRGQLDERNFVVISAAFLSITSFVMRTL